MVKFKGFDETGKVITEECKVYLFKDLPMKGLGKDLSNVNINEIVIIKPKPDFCLLIWDYTLAEIERRADELKSDEVKFMKVPPDIDGAEELHFWFSKNIKHNMLNQHNF